MREGRQGGFPLGSYLLNSVEGTIWGGTLLSISSILPVRTATIILRALRHIIRIAAGSLGQRSPALLRILH